MNRLFIFFGVDADEVLRRCRNRVHSTKTAEVFDRRIQQLAEELERLEQRTANEIARQRKRVESASATVLNLAKKRQEVTHRHARLLARIDSFWRRLGILIRHLFARDTSSVEETKRAIEQAVAELLQIDKHVDQAEVELRSERSRLRELEGPVLSLKYAIDISTIQKQGAIDESARHADFVCQTIQRIARHVSPALLLRKQAVIDDPGDSAWVVDMIRLKRVLLQIDALQRCLDEAALPIEFDAARQLDDAVVAGVAGGSQPIDGTVRVTGNGTTHIKKNRQVEDTVRRSDGTTATASRTESYWDKTSVRFDDTIPVRAEMVFKRWHPAELASAATEHGHRHFAEGVHRFRQKNIRPRLEELRSQERRLVDRLRNSLGLDDA